jgi:CDP-diacylglycerol pyrophosphatase
LASALLAACTPSRPVLPPPPIHANGGVLWHIVHDLCMADRAAPKPCVELSVSDGVEHGYAVLKDQTGIAQYLVMPTQHITGIEDGRILAPDATNYFAAAWRARQLVEDRLGVPLPRDDIGIAVNSIYGRSQDLLHLHVDCLRSDVRDALRREASRVGTRWSQRRLWLAGHRYRAIRIDGDEPGAANPFKLLAEGLAVPPSDMGAWTLVLAGANFAGGRPGFLLVAARADPAKGESASGEILQDHMCANRR